MKMREIRVGGRTREQDSRKERPEVQRMEGLESWLMLREMRVNSGGLTCFPGDRGSSVTGSAGSDAAVTATPDP